MMHCPKLIKLFCSFLLLFVAWQLRAQVITGKVYRFGTDSVIAHASIYLGGTMTGTISDKNGTFKLQVLEGKIPLIVSCVGYNSTVITNYTPGEVLKVYLKPKVNELKAITITGGSSRSRESMVRTFIREFIGTTKFAASCTILNMDDVELSYSRKTGTLTAFCDKAIEIENNKLGYHISYYLDYFNKKGSTTSYDGHFVFKDKATDANRKAINNSRENAYYGSRMQFIRALWNNTLDAHSFGIFSPDEDPVTVDSILFMDKTGAKFIALPYKITILFNDDKRTPTDLGQTQKNCYIDKNGFCEDKLQWIGSMAIQRVGDMLPYEYHSVEDDKPH
ncbi:carboxypeptidase-like regulatory domain-containing protein [Mucilaginibacter sp. AW1-3]